MKCGIDGCTYSMDRPEKSFQNSELMDIIEKIINPELGEVITRGLYTEVKDDITSVNYKMIVHRGEFDFIQHKRTIFMLLIFYAINILSNYYLYVNYLIVNDEELRFTRYTDQYFPISILIVFTSISFVYYIFMQYESINLARMTKYLATAELFSILGAASEIYWAAVFAWSAFVVIFIVNIDITWIKPSKEAQLAFLEVDK